MKKNLCCAFALLTLLCVLAIAPMALAADYPLWVNGVRVSDNASVNPGECVFDPASGTLTFPENVSLTTEHSGYTIYSQLGRPLNIEFAKPGNQVPSIYSDSTVTIHGGAGPLLMSGVTVNAVGDVNISTDAYFICTSTMNITGRNLTLLCDASSPLALSNITADVSGDVKLINRSGFFSNLKITGARNVEIRGNEKTNPLFIGLVEIDASGDVTVINENGRISGSTLKVNSARDLFVSGNTAQTFCVVFDLNVSKNVTLVNKGTSPVATALSVTIGSQPAVSYGSQSQHYTITTGLNDAKALVSVHPSGSSGTAWNGEDPGAYRYVRIGGPDAPAAVPQTGDSAPIALYLSLLLLSCAAMLALARSVKPSRK